MRDGWDEMCRKLERHPKVVEWARTARAQGACHQCQHPTCKGICECKWGKAHRKEVDAATHAQHALHEIYFWAYVAESEGACEQCQHPWHDGICQCQWGKAHRKEGNKIAALAFSLIGEGVEP